MNYTELKVDDLVNFVRTRFQGNRVNYETLVGVITKDLGNGCVLVEGWHGETPFKERRYRCELTPLGDLNAKKIRRRHVRENIELIGKARAAAKKGKPWPENATAQGFMARIGMEVIRKRLEGMEFARKIQRSLSRFPPRWDAREAQQ